MSKLKEIRESRGLSQSALSRLSDVNIQMIQHYEQGVRDINKVQARTIRKLAIALNCNMEDLLEDEISKKI